MSAPFQAPPGMDFNAPIIRMGGMKSQGGGYDDRRGGDGGNRGRAGLGSDSRGGDFGRQSRENNLQPLTKEEVSRTLFVGGIVEGMPQDGLLEEILGVGRGLRRWTRAVDADGKPCTFGFAEYDDASSLELASKLFEEGVDLPLREKPSVKKEEVKQEYIDEKVVKKEEDDEEEDEEVKPKMASLNVCCVPFLCSQISANAHHRSS
jgi:hypothetical protein